MPRVAIVLTDSFPILSLTLVTEPLRVANRELAQKSWQWRILSTFGGPVRSSSGLEIQSQPLDEAQDDIVLLISAYAPEIALTKPLLSWLRRRARAGALMGCVDTGAMIFAEAGLLAKTPAAVHHEALRGYREAYADQMFVDRLHDLSGDRCSSAGGVATFDMTLALIERFNTRDMSRRVAEILNYRPSGHVRDQKKMVAETSLSKLDRTLGRAVDLMLGNLSEPIAISKIVEQLAIPHWTLARLFQRHLNQSPAAYYRHVRLSEAKNLLLNSSYRISAIAGMCGFDNPESFSRAYKRRFGETASQTRSSLSDGTR
ncbi:GlxA family transcriptional regulator [Roseovarius aquimarinus]|uniref:GlxA family transcriptional regulator n=1 Tax=Roseovarius aquimarinus TaxID=1229156 RepID=A0ABW7I7Y1_9RHOB